MTRVERFFAVVVLSLLAGWGSLSCSSELPPPCDSGTAAAMAATCAARVQTECVAKGVAAEDCAALDECDRAATDRETKCGGGK